MYSSGSQLEWREVEGGQLPSPRFGLRATLVANSLYVTGGSASYYNYFTTILFWDSVAETWQESGNLVVPRSVHAALAIPASTFKPQN